MSSALPCRMSPTMRPNVNGMAAETSSMAKIERIVRPGIRILEGMRGIGVEEAAAIGAELLDRFLAGHRPERDDLLGAFERRRLDRALQASAARRGRM